MNMTQLRCAIESMFINSDEEMRRLHRFTADYYRRQDESESHEKQDHKH